MDFGLARAAIEDSDGTQGVGTTGYQAPEVANGETNYTDKADVYSAGMVFYEIVTGVPPSKNRKAYKEAVFSTKGGVLLAKLLRRMLEKDPTERCTAKQALEDLEAIIQILKPASQSA